LGGLRPPKYPQFSPELRNSYISMIIRKKEVVLYKMASYPGLCERRIWAGVCPTQRFSERVRCA
jgi:hypothetical protein